MHLESYAVFQCKRSRTGNRCHTALGERSWVECTTALRLLISNSFSLEALEGKQHAESWEERLRCVGV